MVDVSAARPPDRFAAYGRKLRSLVGAELDLSKEAALFRRILEKDGFSRNVIEIFNHWIDVVLPQQIYARTLTLKEGTIEFANLVVEKPSVHLAGVQIDLTPRLARDRGITYASEMYVDAIFKPKVASPGPAPRTPPPAASEEKRIYIGNIVIMLGSNRCHLYGKTPQQLLAMGECPNDPLGYYIIKGTEKTIIIQEKLRASMFLNYIADAKTGRIESRVTTVTNTGTKIVSMTIGKKWQTLKVKLQHMKENHHIPLFTLFGLLGVSQAAAQDRIMQFVEREHQAKVYFGLQSSFAKDASIGDNKVAYMTRKRKLESSKPYKQREEQIVKDIVRDLFENVPSYDGKIDHLALMAAQTVRAMLGLRPLDDRDAWEIKRLETAARSQEQLMNGLWGKEVDDLQKKIDEGRGKIRTGTMASIVGKAPISPSIITDEMEASFSSNAWGVKGSYVKENITDSLKRETPMAVYSQIARINTPASRKVKQMSIRMVQQSQWGYICPVETPEGEAVGLVKNLALATYISLERPLTEFNAFLARDDIRPLLSTVQDEDHPYPLMVNGQLRRTENGILRVSSNLVHQLRLARRRGELPKDVCIFFNEVDRLVEYYCDGARPTRPLLLVHDGKELVIDRKGLWDADIDVLVREGALEYVDAREQDDIMLAQFPDDVRTRAAEIKRLTGMLREARARSWNSSIGTTVASLFPIVRLMYANQILRAVQGATTPEAKEFDARQTLIDTYTNFLRRLTFNLAILAFEGKSEEKRAFDAAVEGTNLWLEEMLKPLKANEVKGTLAGAETLVEQASIEDLPGLLDAAIGEAQTSVETELKALEAKVPYTHSEIDPIAIFGIAGGLIPQANSNQGPRATYQASMCKQALGLYHLNDHIRFDSAYKKLVTSSRPIFESQIAEPAGLNIMPTGSTPIVAFMAMPQNNEDAIIVKKEYLDANNFELIKYVTHKSAAITNSNIQEEFRRPEAKRGEPEGRYAAINENGLPRIGAYIRQGECIIGKTRDVATTNRRENASLYAGIGEEGYVDRVLVTWNNKKQRVVKVKIRQRRKPQVGDKFASRYSQKGTIGKIVAAKDLPRIVGGPNDGLVPDFIINPHSIPSRMTMGMIKEMLASKASLYTGERIDATTFHKFDIEYYRQRLREVGLQMGIPDNTEAMTNWMNGEERMLRPNGKPIKNTIFVCPCYYQSLRHHVLDKIQMRSRGAIKPMNHQPVPGRANEGGIRVGEMERDAMISHGASGLVLERLMVVSDKYRTSFCRTCGNIAICNPNPRAGASQCRCQLCGHSAKFGILTFPYVYKLILNMLQCFSINSVLRLTEAVRPGGRSEERFLI